ncbi:hypothetical protein GCM10023208_21460 [Erythrobacter westpacificensis]|uniref:Winged helix-turn helix domain-containing protein n=1 Tax=Erythrobacter westpacificensis TaxID=1055231 RepID=A0ABP9KDF6_9SPHN
MSWLLLIIPGLRRYDISLVSPSATRRQEIDGSVPAARHSLVTTPITSRTRPPCPKLSGPRRICSDAKIGAYPLRLSAGALHLGQRWSVVTMKKVYRIYRELGLQMRKKTPKLQVKAKLREDREPAI